MAKFYKYNLAVDLGIASIGYALILVDNDGNPVKILNVGVRTFSVAGGATARREARLSRKHTRNTRQRLNNLEKLLKKNKLLPLKSEKVDTLVLENPYFLRARGVKEKYDDIYYLGRSLMHMAKFRGAGFLSQIEDIEDQDLQGKESSSTKGDKQKSAGSYRVLESILKEKNKSLSEFYAKRLQKGKPVRRRKKYVESKEVEYAVPRFLVKEEFNLIWDFQAKHYPSLDEHLKHKVYNAIFKERPSAPYAIGDCTLLPEEKRLAKMHRLAEERRIYEQINNIRYVSSTGAYPLPKEVRDELVELAFNNGKDLNRTIINKEISKITGERVIKVNLADDETRINGFSHINAFKDIPSWKNLSIEEKDKILDFIAEPKMPSKLAPGQRGSYIYPDDEFIDLLCKKLNLTGEDAGFKASILVDSLPKDRSNLGLTATKAILNKLKKGYFEKVKDDKGKEYEVWRPHTHRTAADACGFTAEEELMRSIAGTFDLLPYYGEVLKHDTMPIHPWHINRAVEEEQRFGRIPNPVVHVALNQLRKVVNEIVLRYGKPQRVHVELARDLGLSEESRNKLINEQRIRERENNRIKEELKEIHLPGTRRNILKYKLWEEQGKKCLFSFSNIAASDLAMSEIEHLIPRSLGGTDTYMNLCLVHPNENFGKSNLFPNEYIKKTNPDKWPEIARRISSKDYPTAKSWRFASDAQEKFSLSGDDEQTDHRMTDTSYIAKLAKRYLSALCSDVVSVKGGTTSYLRHLWGLDALEYDLLGLDIKKEEYDEESGELIIDPLTGYPKRNPLWVAKPRIDHRHHALDAIVAACTTRQMVKTLVLAEKRHDGQIRDFPVPFGENSSDFRYQVQKSLEKILISPKPEHGVEGQLHDDTKYRIIQKDTRKKASANSYLTKYNQSLENIETKKAITGLMFNENTVPLDNEITKSSHLLLKNYIEIIESFYPESEKTIEKIRQEAIASGGRPAKLSKTAHERLLVTTAIKLAQDKKLIASTYPSITYKRLYAINKDLKYGYEARNNHCVDFFVNKKGKCDWELIKTIEANDPSFKPEWEKKGFKKLWSLHKDDVIEVFVDAQFKEVKKIPGPIGKRYLCVRAMSYGYIRCGFINDARPLDGRLESVQAGTNVHEEYKRWDTGNYGLTSYLELKARKIDISPAGKITRKHTRLWKGKKG